MNNTLDERKAIMVLISQVQALRDTIQSTLYNSTAQEHSRYVSFKSYAITYNEQIIMSHKNLPFVLYELS